MKVGDKVKIKEVGEFTGDQRAFYAKVSTPTKIYEVEYIDKLGDIYVKGITNYFRLSSLELVEDVSS